MKEIPIGGEIRIRCVEDKNADGKCTECHLLRKYPCFGDCYPNIRSDGKQVHYEFVETTESSAPTRLTTNQKIDIVNQFYTCQDKWVAKRTIEMVEEMLNQKDKDNEK